MIFPIILLYPLFYWQTALANMWTLLLTSLEIPWTFFFVTFKLVSPSSQSFVTTLIMLCCTSHSQHNIYFRSMVWCVIPEVGSSWVQRGLSIWNSIFQPVFFSFQNATADLFYSQNWFRDLHQILLVYMKNKRLNRQSLPIYFSSQTTHLMNCFLTLMRREFVKSKYLVIKRNLLQSIELDTQLFFENFVKFNTKMNDIYKLIESLWMEDQFPNEMFHNKNQFIGPSEIAQEFNTFVISQFTPWDRQYRGFLPSVLNEIEFSLEEVIETLLQKSDGMGSDNMSGATIRTIATPLSIHFLNVARSILETAKYSDNWKLVDVKPLHKKGAKNIISNYRPVANHSGLSLSFERLLFKHLYKFIAPKINSSQHGFMKNRSTTSQLLLHLKLLHDSFDISEEVFTLYLDICKAFDKVNLYLLIEKLKNFGIGGKFCNFYHPI